MRFYPIPWNADMQRAVPGDSRAGNNSYWAMTSNTAKIISLIFRYRTMAKLSYVPISAAMFSMMFHQLVYNCFHYILAILLYHEFLSQLICHSNTTVFELCYSDKLRSQCILTCPEVQLKVYFNGNFTVPCNQDANKHRSANLLWKQIIDTVTKVLSMTLTLLSNGNEISPRHHLL